MDVVTKEATATATIAPVKNDRSEYGEADVILSTNALDRDGDELHPEEWKTPLPDYITFDTDHGMSVATTVGGGKPFINDSGQLQVRVGFSSIPRAQETRTLTNERIIRNVSVAFLEHKDAKSGKVERELLNGAFVAVPANPEAVILASKSKVTPNDLAAAARKSQEDDDNSSESKSAASNWNPDTMNAVADIVGGDDQGDYQEDPLNTLDDHIRGIHEAATKFRDFYVKLRNGIPDSDPDAIPIDLAPNNRSASGAVTKSSPQESTPTEAPATAAVPAETDGDVELLKAKAWANAFLLSDIEDCDE